MAQVGVPTLVGFHSTRVVHINFFTHFSAVPSCLPFAFSCTKRNSHLPYFIHLDFQLFMLKFK